MSDIQNAFRLIGSLDLTSLSHDDTEEKIAALCAKAVTPYGTTAAVCVYPEWVPLARKLLKKTPVKVATVVNFPAGGNDFKLMKDEIKKGLSGGADEIDAVFPYRDFLAGNLDSCRRFLDIIQRECGKHTSKIILETGELNHVSTIAAAVKLCLEYDIDFIKTSTGKTPVSATVGAANIILETIRDSGRDVGFKASGGIREFEEARKYLILSEVILGADWPDPAHFRIGASSLLDDLIRVIENKD